MTIAKTKPKKNTVTVMPPAPVENLPAVQSDSVAIAARQVVSVIERAINNPKLDVKKMQAIMDMQMAAIRFQAEIAYNKAMTDCQAIMPHIKANKFNKQTNSNYADLAAIDTVIRPIYTSHGFNLSFDTEQLENGNIRIICWVRHREGHKERHTLTGALDAAGFKGTANKTGIQASGSTVSYLQRYTTKMIFNVIIEGEDNDGNSKKPEKREDEFSRRVQDDATPPDRMDPERPLPDPDKPWNGKTIVLDGKATDKNFEGAVSAARYLMHIIKNRKHKKSRVEIVSANVPLIRALAEAGEENLISEMHALADKGE